MSDRIKPHFRKKMPENAIEFFSRDSDDKFKAEHPGCIQDIEAWQGLRLFYCRL